MITVKEAKAFAERLVAEYGEEGAKREMASRTGCNPDNKNLYELIYCSQFNWMLRGSAVKRCNGKSKPEDLFRED